MGGLAVVSRMGGEPSLTRVVQLEDRPWGLALTRGGGLLIVASDDRSTAKGAIMVVARDARSVGHGQPRGRWGNGQAISPGRISSLLLTLEVG
jgi:hypothetical protein